MGDPAVCGRRWSTVLEARRGRHAVWSLLVAAFLSAAPGWQAGRDLLRNPDHPEMTRSAPDRYVVRLETTRGTIDIEVTRDWSPRGADRFYNLVRHGFFDEARFFRVIAGRWAQFGIPADPEVARIWRTRMLPDEPRKVSNERGTIAYAFRDPNGRTTQVFINLQDNRSTHDAEPFVPFGRVIAGMEVADALYSNYGEESGGGIRRGRQDALFAEGNAYLLRNFPRLDFIRRATIVEH